MHVYFTAGSLTAFTAMYMTYADIEKRINGYPIKCVMVGHEVTEGYSGAAPIWSFETNGSTKSFVGKYRSWTLPSIGSTRTLYLCRHELYPSDTLYSLGTALYLPWVFYGTAALCGVCFFKIRRMRQPLGNLRVPAPRPPLSL